MSWRTILIVLLLVFGVSRCAQQAPLTGGKRDTQAPRLVKSVPLQHTLHFSEKEIVLEFDELIQLADLSNQLIISPSLSTPPEITAEGRKVRIRFEAGSLEKETTYRMNFGKAIVDVNESNRMEGLDFVFSTGDHIDTLTLDGRASDALTNRPAGGAVVALYRGTPDDSMPFKTPQYYTRAGEDGAFRLANLPSTPFSVFVFNDKNRNNMYDGETERIGFSDKAVIPGSDSLGNIRLFQEESPRLFVRKSSSPYYGMTLILMNRKGSYSLAPLERANAKAISINGEGGDTARIFYHGISDTLRLLFNNKESKETDTMLISIPPLRQKSRKFEPQSVKLSWSQSEMKGNIRITFPNWIDTSGVRKNSLHLRLEKDSVERAFRLRWTGPAEAEVVSDYAEGKSYVLRADTSAFRDMHGRLSDTLLFKTRIPSRTDFGNVIINYKPADKQPQIIELINEREEVVASKQVRISLSSANSIKLEFPAIAPGAYRIRVIADVNENGRWDNGSLLRRTQPEVVTIFLKTINVTADWDIEEEISFRDQKTK